MALAVATHHSAQRGEWRDPNEALRGHKTASAAGQRPGVFKDPEPQREIARVRMTDVSGLPYPGYVPQLHGDELVCDATGGELRRRGCLLPHRTCSKHGSELVLASHRLF